MDKAGREKLGLQVLRFMQGLEELEMLANEVPKELKPKIYARLMKTAEAFRKADRHSLHHVLNLEHGQYNGMIRGLGSGS